MPHTPPFVRWTLPLACALRDETNTDDPEQTERQLRSLRAYSDCVYEGRQLDGICVSGDDPTLGFPAQEVLFAYGGAELVHQQCDGCRVNVLKGRLGSGVAGCFGTLVLDQAFTLQLEEALARVDEATQSVASCLPTFPRWYGLWMHCALHQRQLQAVAAVFAGIKDAAHPMVSEFRMALRIASEEALPLHARLYPAGEATENIWRVAAHCSRCKAGMQETERRCGVCGLVARAEPPRQRKVRGNRPFVSLTRFLGVEAARDFSWRYQAAHQGGPHE